MIRKTLAVAALGTVLLTGMAFAAGSTLPNPLSTCSDFNCLATLIVNFLWAVAIPLSTIMMLWGGFKMMTSAGDPEKFSEGVHTLQTAALGFLIVLLSAGLVSVIKSFFGA